MVQLASYQVEEEALELLDLLSDHGIPATIRNSYSARLLSSFIDIGGFIVEVPESARPQIQELIESGELILPDESDEPTTRLTQWVSKLPLPDQWSLEKRLTMLLLLLIAIGIIIALAVLVVS
ncbi:hypothetical protein PORUE0001_0695 [Porphyromonas uenonis 60-3]|uniref:DUF2007 domain-containing protein n=2 Tax=Porphyromonas uenonis TaxID=281920 RepID=C2MBL1_9PORP|nr:hypothetical protein PORUE0001_0695 [Porphyromonas uenonis 60-3]